MKDIVGICAICHKEVKDCEKYFWCDPQYAYIILHKYCYENQEIIKNLNYEYT